MRIMKLKGRGGFTLIEALISVALLGIFTMGIGVGVSAAAQTMGSSVTVSEAGLLSDTLVKAIRGELRYARDIVSGGGTAVYTSQRYGTTATIVDNPNTEGNARIYVASDAGYFDLLSEGAYTNLQANVSVTYNEAQSTFEVELRIILPGGQIRTTNFKVYTLL